MVFSCRKLLNFSIMILDIYLVLTHFILICKKNSTFTKDTIIYILNNY